ncbi:Bardet-Biedl syndrome 7 -like protein [Trichinella spiralis]|uniref:Bardet-Biedl syndrome 7-like protein n=1 Tax=Trichinella spiralis TaxID=6334 RepID=A0A0V1BIP4_TRISP|nr:Bardet-Biedl syndrome 7 -like protein [Trichinella spiralis]
MKFNWYRSDYLQTSPTSRRCMRLLPCLPGGGGLQQLVVAHQNGVVACVSWKKKPVIDFKTFPDARIDAIALGGEEHSACDKIFLASGSVVKGYNRRGKHFLDFDINKTDSIKSMSIYGVDMVLCSEYTMTHYHDCSETSYYLSDDRIYDTFCISAQLLGFEVDKLCILLACENHLIKILLGQNLLTQVEVGDIPSTLLFHSNLASQADGIRVFYGTVNGRIGQLQIYKENVKILWELPSENGVSFINTMELCDVHNTGILNLIVGREDGLIEIYDILDNDKPMLTQYIECHESIVALQCGHFTSTESNEIIVCSFSGNIFGWSTECAQSNNKVSGENGSSAGVGDEIQQLRDEVEELRRKVQNQRTDYLKRTEIGAHQYSCSPSFAINDRFVLNSEETAYLLSVELPIAIDWILLRPISRFKSEVAVSLLDIEKNSAVVSVTPTERNSKDALLITYRCQANMVRFEVKIRTIEGKYGNLELYISPRMNPGVCQICNYLIKPLSLHRRTQTFDDNRPQNCLRISGNFDIATAYAMMSFCLPGMSEHLSDESKITCYFVSCFIGTQLCHTCSGFFVLYFSNFHLFTKYRDGEIVIRSDNISTIAILLDVINREASNRGLKLDITCDIDQTSVAHVLRLVNDRIQKSANLLKKIRYAEILKDATIRDDEREFFTDDFEEIFQNSSQLLEQKQAHQAYMDLFLTSLVFLRFLTDLFVDSFKFKGEEVKHRVPQLIELIENYDHDKLQRFFNGDWDAV